MREIDIQKLYDLASDKAVSLEEEIHNFSRLLYHNFELKIFFENGSIPRPAKGKLLADLFPGSSLLFRELIDLLLNESLIRKLGWLQREYSKLVSQKTGIPVVRVSSARELSGEEKSKLEEFTRGRLRFEVDPALIGGLRIKWDDGRYLDASLSGMLKKLEEEILV